WATGLEQKVAERTEQLQTSNASLEQRNAELAIINSVQQGLAAQLDIHTIYELVGDKIRDIFDAQVVVIVVFDAVAELAHYVYAFEQGERLSIGPRPPAGFSREVLRTGQPLYVAQDVVARSTEYGQAMPLAGAPVR